MAFLDSTGLNERQKRSWAKHLNHLSMASTAKALLPLSAAILALLLIASFATAQSDADGDGVEDNEDDCPDTAEGQTVGADGCSEEQLNIIDNDYLKVRSRFSLIKNLREISQ